MLITIKLLHTVIWAILAGCIVALPFAGWLKRFRLAAILSAVILLECAVLAANQGRCPLTDLARHYSFDPADNFDIYLPNWLARHNKTIFGFLFIVGELVVAGCWLRDRKSTSREEVEVSDHSRDRNA